MFLSSLVRGGYPFWIMVLLITGMITPLAAQFQPRLADSETVGRLQQRIHRQTTRLLVQLERDQATGETLDQLADLRLLHDFLLDEVTRFEPNRAVGQRIAQRRDQLDDIFDQLDRARAKSADRQTLIDALRAVLARPEPPAFANDVPEPLWYTARAKQQQPNWSRPDPLAATEPRAAKAADAPTPLLDQLPAEARANPVALLTWIENHIAHDPYFGGYRPSTAVLRERAANDLDTCRLVSDLLWEMGVASRLVHGRVRVEAPRLAALLRVHDGSSAAAVLTAAGIPYQAETGGQLAAFQFERFWLEVYLPLGNYRGLDAGSGDRAWIAVDPAWGLFQQPTFSDPLAGIDLDAPALLEEYETDPSRDALAWLNDRFSQLTGGSDLTALAAVLTPSAVAPGLLDLSLPYQVVERLATHAAVPESMEQRMAFTVRDGADQIVLETEVAVARLYELGLAWDAQPHGEADHALAAAHGGWRRVPTELIQLRPGLLLGGTPLAATSLPFRPGDPLLLETRLLGPDGSTHFQAQQPLAAGGFSVLTLLGNPHPLVQQDEPAVGESDPFGNFMIRRGQTWLIRAAAAEQRLARAMGLIPVQPAPALVWSHLTHEVTYLDGNPVAMDLKTWYLDAEGRPTRLVPSATAIPADRAAAAHLLAGLVAAQEEARVLEVVGEGIAAVSVPDLFKQAQQQGLTPLDIQSEAELNGLDLPARMEARLRQALTRGLEVRLVAALQSGDFRCSGARLLDPTTGSNAWLMDGDFSGAVISSVYTHWDSPHWDAATFPRYLFLPPGPDQPQRVFFLLRDLATSYSVRQADDGDAVLIRYKALDLLGRPAVGASITLTLINRQGGISEEQRAYTAVTDQLGFAAFQVRPPNHNRGAYLFMMKQQPSHAWPDLAGFYHYLAHAESGLVLGNYTSTVVQFPGQPARLRVVPGSQQSVQSSIVPLPGTHDLADAVPLLTLVGDQHGNLITNREVVFSSDPESNEVCAEAIDEVMRIAVEMGIDDRPLTHYFFRDSGEAARYLTRYSWTSRYLDAGGLVNAHAGLLNQKVLTDRTHYLLTPEGWTPFEGTTSLFYEDKVTVRVAGTTLEQEVPLYAVDDPGASGYRGCWFNADGLPPERVCDVPGPPSVFGHAHGKNSCLDLNFGEGNHDQDAFGWPLRHYNLAGGTRQVTLPVRVDKFVARQTGGCQVLAPCPIVPPTRWELFSQTLEVGIIRKASLDFSYGNVPYTVAETGPGTFDLQITLAGPGIYHGAANYTQELRDTIPPRTRRQNYSPAGTFVVAG